MNELGIIGFDEKIEAPDFKLKDLNGQEVRLKDHRGRIVFLNFWATWCLPCREEMPSMEKLYAEFKDRNFSLLAVDLQEDSRKVTTFKEKYRLSFPILLDSDGTVGLTYGARFIPTTYLLDRDGTIIGKVLGARDWSGKLAFAFFNHLLNTSSGP
jgi:peroxiredoxin